MIDIFSIWLSLAGFQMGLKMSWKFWSFNCIFSRIEHVKLSFNRSVFINLTHLLKKNMLTKSSICSTYWHANRMLMYIARNRLKVILLHDYKFFFIYMRKPYLLINIILYISCVWLHLEKQHRSQCYCLKCHIGYGVSCFNVFDFFKFCD